MQIRRVVTGFGEDGAPTVMSDGPAAASVALPAALGVGLVDLWRSDSLPLATTGDDDPTTSNIFALMPTGSLFRIIDLEPGDHAPMWHTTASVDFVYVAAGEITFRCGSPEASTDVRLATGDTLVQRGIPHAWVNEGAETCRLVNASVAATLPEGVSPDVPS